MCCEAGSDASLTAESAAPGASALATPARQRTDREDKSDYEAAATPGRAREPVLRAA
jgi:hypothetical protein